ncbi:S24 family peptidase [Enterococcus lactis]|uniref:S24 family peptidase n=1 Tax=Enterococcus lactis TaxID=357441 RepID=UPI001BD173ED|nr:S24 family peptidase [Enterococcus lactis]
MKQTTQQRLNQLMSERNLKQVDILNMSLPLQKETGIKMSKSHLSQYVNGKSSPDQYKLYLLAKTLNVSEAWLLGYDVPKEDKKNDVPSIESIYNQLDQPRKTKVYNFAEQQLEEQNSNVVQFPVQNNHEEVQAYLSAGTGILNYYEADKDIVEVPADAPEHDWIFKIAGISMKPLFDDGDIVYVDEFKQGIDSIQNGRIYVVEVDGEAYIKKVYVYEETKTLRLVSLNKDYKDLLFRFEDSDINFIGRVII